MTLLLIMQNYVKLPETSWNYLRLLEITWNYLTLPEFTWDHLKPDENYLNYLKIKDLDTFLKNLNSEQLRTFFSQYLRMDHFRIYKDRSFEASVV